MSKYGAIKTVVDGITFASRREAQRYGVLRMLVKAGKITDLQMQPKFVLAKSVKFAGTARAKPAMVYSADFAYTDVATGIRVVEDVKGAITTAFQIKRHLMLAIHGVDVRLVR